MSGDLNVQGVPVLIVWLELYSDITLYKVYCMINTGLHLNFFCTLFTPIAILVTNRQKSVSNVFEYEYFSFNTSCIQLPERPNGAKDEVSARVWRPSFYQYVVKVKS